MRAPQSLMQSLTRSLALVALTAGLAALAPAPTDAQPAGRIQLTEIGRYETGVFDDGAAEIAAYDPASERLFVVNAAAATVDVLDISQPWNPTRITTLDVSADGASANSVAISAGVAAVAIEAEDAQAPGRVTFFDAATGDRLSSVEVGPLPDMVTFSPDGRWAVVANEGEPKDYCEPGLANDPEGSVSVIDLSGGVASLTQAAVRTAGFGAFEGSLPDGIRVFGPGATVAQDLEPEYVAVSSDSSTAWVTLQENNALAVVDIASATVTALVPLGVKDHRLAANGLDASNRDDEVRIRTWPVLGLYQPDSIASYRVAGGEWLVTANEGDARDYDCFSEEERIADIPLDPEAYPRAEELQKDENLGRLVSTTATGDVDDDGLHEILYTFGGRSFSIWSADGELVWDSGREIELLTAALLGDDFNSNNDENGSFDSRSDDKGPEPEAVTTGFFRGRWYAFVGLERVGGIMVYDITDPRAPFFVTYVNPRDFQGDAAAGTAGDLGPESVVFIPQNESPINRALLVTANEVSGSVSVFSVLPGR